MADLCLKRPVLDITIIMSHSWNSDERSTDGGLTPLVSHEPEYIPVWKILKEMYDEDKERLYCISTESKVEASIKKPGLPVLGKGLAKYTARLVRKMDITKTVLDEFEELVVSEGESEELESEPEPEQEPGQEQETITGESDPVPEQGIQKQEDESTSTPAEDPSISKHFWYT